MRLLFTRARRRTVKIERVSMGVAAGPMRDHRRRESMAFITQIGEVVLVVCIRVLWAA
jgi:hypothetical protein